MGLKVEVVFEGVGEEREFYWDDTMNYGRPNSTKKMNPIYAVQIADLASNYAGLVSKTAGSAAAGDPTYKYSFKLTGPDLPDAYKAGGKLKVEGEAGDLLYSEGVALQNAGIKLLAQLNVFAEYEIKAGKRKLMLAAGGEELQVGAVVRPRERALIRVQRPEPALGLSLAAPTLALSADCLEELRR